MIVPVLEKRIFEFGFLATGSQEVVLHPAIDVSDAYRIRLIVRVHAISAATGNFNFKLQHTLPSEQDSQEFTDASADFMATGPITTASPNIKTVTNTDPQAFLKLILRATQITSGTTLYGEFSAVMVLGPH